MLLKKATADYGELPECHTPDVWGSMGEEGLFIVFTSGLYYRMDDVTVDNFASISDYQYDTYGANPYAFAIWVPNETADFAVPQPAPMLISFAQLESAGSLIQQGSAFDGLPYITSSMTSDIYVPDITSFIADSSTVFGQAGGLLASQTLKESYENNGVTVSNCVLQYCGTVNTLFQNGMTTTVYVASPYEYAKWYQYMQQMLIFVNTCLQSEMAAYALECFIGDDVNRWFMTSTFATGDERLLWYYSLKLGQAVTDLPYLSTGGIWYFLMEADNMTASV